MKREKDVTTINRRAFIQTTMVLAAALSVPI